MYHSRSKWLNHSNNHITRAVNHQIRFPRKRPSNGVHTHWRYLRSLQEYISKAVQKKLSFIYSNFMNTKCIPSERIPLVETSCQVFYLTSLIWIILLSHSIKKSILLIIPDFTNGYHSRVQNILHRGKSWFWGDWSYQRYRAFLRKRNTKL